MHIQRAAADWRARRHRRESRQNLIAAVGNLVALHLGVLFLSKVLPGTGSVSEAVADLCIWLLAAFDVLLVLRTEAALKVADIFVTRTGATVVRAVTVALLVLLWVMSWPLARTVGRRQALRRRPALAPWLDGGEWRRSTWTEKRSEAVTTRGRLGRRLPAVFALLGWFLGRRNAYTFLMVAVLLVLLSLTIATQAPALAPFIYTLF